MPHCSAELTEEDLVIRAQQGDANAFGDLYERHLDKIYRYVFYRVGDVAEAEDVTETVFLKAWEALDRYRFRDIPFSAWLYRISHNAIIDRYRAQKDMLVSLESQPDLRDWADGPEDQLDALESSESLAWAISQLAPDYQQVLALRFVSGLSHGDTARIMSRSEEAVRVLQHRALRVLREQLTQRIRTHV
jgi:RNA polymerase sigma-70 factor (ECF subfamily)